MKLEIGNSFTVTTAGTMVAAAGWHFDRHLIIPETDVRVINNYTLATMSDIDDTDTRPIDAEALNEALRKGGL